MEITTDVILKGNLWKELTEKLRPIFKTNWEVYKICTGIGIMYDKHCRQVFMIYEKTRR